MTGPPWPGSQIHPGEAPASRRWTSVGSFPSWQKAFIVSRSFCRQEIGDECFLQLTTRWSRGAEEQTWAWLGFAHSAALCPEGCDSEFYPFVYLPF